MGFKGAILTGPVSRSPKTIQEHRLLRDGHSTKEKFMELVEKDSKEIIQAQKDFAFVSAGQLDWLDLLRPLAYSFQGVEKRNSSGEDSVGPVTRWYSTNTFYRKPNITEKISAQGKELVEFLPKVEKGVVFLLGPYSFVRLVQNNFYKDSKEMVLDYGKAIAENTETLKEKGYQALLFSEPSFGFNLLKNNFDKSLLVKDFAESLKEKGFTVGVNFPLADASKFLGLFDDSSFDFVGVDAVYSDFTKIKTKKDVLIGAVDGARIGIESSEGIKKVVEEFRSNAEFSENYFIGTNDRLFDVPFEQGMEKIKVLSKTAEELIKNE